jgi:transcriptional regulator with XRE-family HTH domain
MDTDIDDARFRTGRDYLGRHRRPRPRSVPSASMAAVASLDRVSFGDRLRAWRMRRRMSQLQLSNEAGVSARHLSFLETGRSRPSREIVLHLAEHLDVPLRERNTLLVAAGYAPVYRETALEEAPMAPIRDAIDDLLRGHEPYPAVLVDRHWDVVNANRPVQLLLAGVSPALLQPPINVMRVSLHPEGLAPHVVNYDEYRAHLLTRLARQVHLTGDDRLRELYDEVRAYGPPDGRELSGDELSGDEPIGVVLPMRLRTPSGELNLFSMVSTFGTAVDITLDELALESFFPADADTAAVLRSLG